MTSCWKKDPDSRPSFSELVPVLSRYVAEMSVRFRSTICNILKRQYLAIMKYASIWQVCCVLATQLVN